LVAVCRVPKVATAFVRAGTFVKGKIKHLAVDTEVYLTGAGEPCTVHRLNTQTECTD
jgi:hypothetical protein